MSARTEVTTEDRLARLVTEVLAPANLVIGLLILVAWHSASNTIGKVGWGLGAALFAGVLPLAYLVRGARQGRWEDHHVGEREKRPAVILAILGSVLVGVVLMVTFDAPRELLALMGAMVAGLVVTLAVTLIWKISVHAAVAGGTAVILALARGRQRQPGARRSGGAQDHVVSVRVSRLRWIRTK